MLLALLWSSVVQAALIISPSDPALTGGKVDDFSSYSVGDALAVSDGIFTVTQNGGSALSVVDNFGGSFGIVGRSIVSYSGSGIEVNFVNAVSAFGIHIGAADVGVVWTIEASNSRGVSLGSRSVSVDLNARSNGFFMGWVSADIASVTLTPSAVDSAIFDHLSYVELTASEPRIIGTSQGIAAAIQAPGDGGSGPVIWYRTAGTQNLGSGDNTLTLSSQGAMTDKRPDFFGSPQDAFALAGDQTQGSAIQGSEATSYLSGNRGAVAVMFQTPQIITTKSAILGRSPIGAIAGEPKFELAFLADGTLQLTTGDTVAGRNTSIGNLAPSTWYYLAVSWDLLLPANQVSWYLGKMGDLTLTRGYVDQVSAIGDPGSQIRVAGRLASDLNRGAYQNLAIYDRPLGEGAIKNQFLRALAFRVTGMDYQEGGQSMTMLRWTDNLAAVYQVVGSDTLPFGGPSDLLIPVTSTSGLIDRESHPGEVQFTFSDPGDAGWQRFWRVQIDLDQTLVIINVPGNTTSLQAMIDSLGGVGVIDVTNTFVIDSPITIPAGIELKVWPSGKFDILNPAYLTIEGSVSSGLYPIFNGIVTFAEGSVAAVKSEWWGTEDLSVNFALLSAGEIPVKVTNDLAVNSAILMNSKQTLDLYGAGVFPSAPMTGGAVIKNRSAGATEITILGGMIDGTAESTVGYDAILLTDVSNSLIKDVTCNNVHIRSSLDTGNIHLVNSSHTRIENCNVSGSWKMGVKIDFGSHNSIIGGYFFDTHDSGIGAISSPYLLIDGVYVDNCGTSDASNIAANLQYATIRNSISVNGTGTANGNGITIGHQGYPAIDSVCENNLFLNNSAKAIFLQGTETTDITVRNNIILDNGVGSSGQNSGGVAIYAGVENSLVTNNELLGNRLGVSLMQTSKDNLIENNRIKSSTLHGVRSDGIDNTLKSNELANSSNILNDVNEVRLIKITNTEAGSGAIDYSYLLDLPLTDLQKSVLEDYLN